MSLHWTWQDLFLREPYAPIDGRKKPARFDVPISIFPIVTRCRRIGATDFVPQVWLIRHDWWEVMPVLARQA